MNSFSFSIVSCSGVSTEFSAESPALAVEIVQCGTHRLFVCLPSVVHHYLPDGFFFGDAAFEALLAYRG